MRVGNVFRNDLPIVRLRDRPCHIRWRVCESCKREYRFKDGEIDPILSLRLLYTQNGISFFSSGFKGSAAVSAVYTGISYFVTAIILATPYFLTKIMLDALFASLAVAVLVIAFISFYGSVISGTVFSKDFIEVTSIMLSATVALYILGFAIRHLTGITI